MKPKGFCRETSGPKDRLRVRPATVAGRVICGNCGRAYGRKVWNSTDERLRKVVWRCNKKYKVNSKWQRLIDEDDMLKRVYAKRFVEIFKTAELIEKFDFTLFYKLVEKIIVQSEEILVVAMYDGTEIECEINSKRKLADLSVPPLQSAYFFGKWNLLLVL